ncbi:MAG: hypothetical protein AMS24_01050 [Chlamydiae bacterium SM23_39]|nr:MAG: hypothetical protein AMS24_01050 [Chlamydiae bacterium SM23_39]
MIERFSEILKELGDIFSIHLKPDRIDACSLKIDEKLHIQLKLNKTEEFILIGGNIINIYPGKFRENIFFQTLKANSQIPKIGSFAFNEKDSNLVMYEYVPMNDLTTEKLKNILGQFIEKAFSWREAIESNQSAPLEFIKEFEKKDGKY